MANIYSDAFLPFHQPDIGDEEIREVVNTLCSGWLTTGPKTRRFEQEFADYLGGGVTALAVNSATSGLHLALEALGVGPGDEVITTTYTFTATAEVIRYLGADPVFVDILEDSYNIDPAAVEAAITPRTKAIVPVHIGGLACDMDILLQIAKQHKLYVVEDAAHALPAKMGGRLIGTLNSDATVFSFYATKTLATGEGGMLVTRNPKIAKRARMMRLHGIDRDVFDRYTSKKPDWFYSVTAPGFKYNMTDLAASLGIHQLAKADKFRERRAYLAARYDKAFQKLNVILPSRASEDDAHAWHLYAVRLKEGVGILRNDFIAAMSTAGIGTSVHFIPLHMHPYWRDRYKLNEKSFPIATRVFSSVVSLPLYTKMTDADQDRVMAAVQMILGRAGKIAKDQLEKSKQRQQQEVLVREEAQHEHAELTAKSY